MVHPNGTNGDAGRRAVRIAGCSGSVTDRRDALARLAASSEVDVIIGDWMSEYNMTTRGGDKVASVDSAWEPSFIEALEPALDALAANKRKLVCNAGASDTEKLAKHVQDMVDARGLKLKVGWVEGDEVFEQVSRLIKSNNKTSFMSLTTDTSMADWPHEPIYAQAYLGSFGVVAALEEGADIVLCGRVADASPLIGLGAWWHSWKRTDYDALAGAFVAGHIAECSTYVTGGNWSGFKSLAGNWTDLGYPIVELAADGTFITTKESNTGGVVNEYTIASQLVYEIQGPLYYNSDVVADLRNIQLETLGKDRVRLTGVTGLPPPPTTKVGVTAKGGHQAELAYYLCGLDIKEKAQMLEDQIRANLSSKGISLLKFMVTGTAAADPASQDEATVEFRIFAQARERETLSFKNFFRVISDQIMQSYPGATFGVDTRKAEPKPFYEYFVSVLGQTEIQHRAHVLGGRSVEVPPPSATRDFERIQTSHESANPIPLSEYGPTKKGPLGLIVHARSGDKGSDANVGFYTRNDDEWPWLRDLLSTEKVKELLGKDYRGERIDRFEIPGIRAVHFLLKNHLDRGVASTSTYDYLGKNVAEYLRAKYVELPVKFLERGTI